MVEPFNSSVEMDYDKMVYENKGWEQNMTGGNEMSPEMSPEMEYDEMVYNKENDDRITAGGYSVNSLLLNQGMPAAYADHVGGKGKKHGDEKVSDRFKHLAVPAGLYLGTNTQGKYSHINESTIINDDLYEKLLKLAQPDNNHSKENDNNKQINKKKLTKKKKHKKSIKRKTRRK